MIDTILDPQIWLVLVALVHAVVGVILPTEWEDDTNKLVSGWFLLTTVTMLGTAFLLEGEAMARMAVVIAGPVWVWFVIICAQGLEWKPGQDPDDDELEGQRPSACALGNSGVERPPGLRMGLRR